MDTNLDSDLSPHEQVGVASAFSPSEDAFDLLDYIWFHDLVDHIW